eukprot:395233-Amorphochlora_amoeboformis.AAC.1
MGNEEMERKSDGGDGKGRARARERKRENDRETYLLESLWRINTPGDPGSRTISQRSPDLPLGFDLG